MYLIIDELAYQRVTSPACSLVSVRAGNATRALPFTV